MTSPYLSATGKPINWLYARLAHLNNEIALQYVLLAIITAGAAILRFYKLGQWSFWIDEIFTLTAVENTPAFDITWPRISLTLIGLTLQVAEPTEWSARLVPALIGIITLPILYFPIRKLFGASVALIAVMLLAVSPWHLFWSQNARFYTSLMLFYSLGLFLFFIGLEENRIWYIIGSLLLLALATVERFTALFFVPVIAVYLLLLQVGSFQKPTGFTARNLLILSLPLLAAGTFEIYLFATSGSSIIISGLTDFVGEPIDDPFRLASFIGFSLGLPLITLAFFVGVYLLFQKDRAGLFIFISALLPVLLLLLISPFVFTKNRYIFITLYAWITLAAVGVKIILDTAKNTGKIIAVGVLVLLLVDSLGSNLLYYTVNHGNRHDWKGAFALVQENSQEGDMVVATRAELGNYYLNHEVTWMGDLTPKMVENNGKRIWFVTDSESVWVTGPIQNWIRTNGELIDVRYLRVPEDISLRIYLYDPQ